MVWISDGASNIQIHVWNSDVLDELLDTIFLTVKKFIRYSDAIQLNECPLPFESQTSLSLFFGCFQILGVRYSDHWQFEFRKHLKSRPFDGQISNGPVFKWSGLGYRYGYSPNHKKTRPLKIWTFLSSFQMVFDKMTARFQMAGLTDFRSHSKFWPLLDRSKSRLICISDPHCILYYLCVNDLIVL